LTDRFQRIAELFEHARQLPDAAARDSYLDAECEAELRGEVDALLNAHEPDIKRDSAILPGLGEAVSAAWSATQAEPAAPELVEGFQIIERIGSGGMGTVYAAQQIEPARRVALKVLRPEADRDRFRREVLALARLQHPGIAQILLSGECTTPMGRSPFLAMELIDGTPVDKFAQTLDRRARIELTIRICDAIAHAHRRGIIHRDLKPNNILVTKDGQPKVLDFGLAMATDDSDDGFERQTKTGHLVGTLAYMSPEQAAGTRDAVDTRSDVYALGVLAYEMLTGKLPHALDDLPLQTALRTLTDEDPEAPQDVRGDLWIILRKALAKDPEQRYLGAASFADDLRRYLADEPIEARRPSAMYQMRKFVRRHKAPVAGLVATMAALVVGFVLALRAADREHGERERADRERDIARAAAAHAYLKAAAGDFATHRFGSAKKNLEQIKPEFRDWEWEYLSARLDRSVEFRPWPPDASVSALVNGLAAHPDLAKPRDRIVGHSYRVEQDLETKSARLFDARRPDAAPIELTGISRGIVDVHVGPHGKSIVVQTRGTGHRSNRLLVYEPTGAPRHELVGHVGLRGYLAFDSSGTRLAFGGFGGRVLTFDVFAGRRLMNRYLPAVDAISSVAFGPGDRIACGARDTAIHIIDSKDGEVLQVLRGHSAQVTGVAFCRDGKTLVSAAYDGSVRVWDLETSRVRDVIAVPHLHVGRLAFDEDETSVWAACGDGCRRWRIDEARLTTLRHHKLFAYAVAFHPDGRTLASGAYQDGIRVVDTRNGRLVSKLPKRMIWWLDFAPNGDLYSSSGRYSAASTDLEKTQTLFGGSRGVGISPDGSRIAGGGGTGKVRLYRPAEDRIEAEWDGFETRTEEFAFSPDGMRLAIVGTGGFFQVRSVPDGAIVFERKLDHELNAVAYHPSRPLIATAGYDNVIRIWDIDANRLHRQLEGHTGRIWSLRFHPSGTRLFSGAQDCTVRIWDPESGLEKLRLQGHGNYVYSIDLSPDGKTLASGSGDFSVRLWSTRSMRALWKEAEE
jgi:WD40 repeat protein/predicted Ser/Thr protein kinase